MDRLTRVRGYKNSSSSNGLNDEEEKESLLGSDSMTLGNLHPKKRGDWSPSKAVRDQTIECDIQPSDSLKSLALKYNIPLSELKRVNNIINEAEFFALKRIKIPVKPTQLNLTDLLPGVHSEESRNNNGWLLDSKDSPVLVSSEISSRVSSGYSSPYSEPDTDNARVNLLFHESKDKKKVKRFLKDMDKDLDRIKERNSEIVNTSNDITSHVGEVRKYPLKASQIPSEDPGINPFSSCNKHCNMIFNSGWLLVGLVVSVVIAIVFCILVVLTQHFIEHHDTTKSTHT